LDFDLRAHESGDRMVVTITGDLDVFTAPRLRDYVVDLIDEGHLRIYIDLRPCEFLDSSGLSALVSAHKRLHALGGELALVCPRGNLRRLIEIVSLDQVFDIRDDLDARAG
jgi:anti-sigma B factor antagonist